MTALDPDQAAAARIVSSAALAVNTAEPYRESADVLLVKLVKALMLSKPGDDVRVVAAALLAAARRETGGEIDDDEVRSAVRTVFADLYERGWTPEDAAAEAALTVVEQYRHAPRDTGGGIEALRAPEAARTDPDNKWRLR